MYLFLFQSACCHSNQWFCRRTGQQRILVVFQWWSYCWEIDLLESPVHPIYQLSILSICCFSSWDTDTHADERRLQVQCQTQCSHPDRFSLCQQEYHLGLHTVSHGCGHKLWSQVHGDKQHTARHKLQKQLKQMRRTGLQIKAECRSISQQSSLPSNGEFMMDSLRKGHEPQDSPWTTSPKSHTCCCRCIVLRYIDCHVIKAANPIPADRSLLVGFQHWTGLLNLYAHNPNGPLQTELRVCGEGGRIILSGSSLWVHVHHPQNCQLGPLEWGGGSTTSTLNESGKNEKQ